MSPLTWIPMYNLPIAFAIDPGSDAGAGFVSIAYHNHSRSTRASCR
jgi:hypothetical protein